ncbi:MAG: hypothetical protein ACYTGZ_19345 [Planctomycetota bacterium]|jgi:dipeptidyl aminopeptidase/acylaminoacyl peptidase
MHLLIALLLFAYVEPEAAKIPKAEKRWMILLADNSGGYWVDAATGKVTPDPKLRRRTRKPAKLDPNSQLVAPPTFVRRYRDESVTTAKGVTVRMLKNRLRLESKDKKTWLTKAGVGIRPVLRPDGKTFAYIRWSEATWSGKSRKANLVIRDLATGKERAVVKDAHLNEASWSPDGKLLAVGTHTAFSIYDVASGKRVYHRALRDIHDDLYAHAPEGIVWHPDGQRLAMRCVFLGGRTASADGEFEEVFGDAQLYLLDLKTKKFRVHKLPKSTCEGPIRAELKKVEK